MGELWQWDKAMNDRSDSADRHARYSHGAWKTRNHDPPAQTPTHIPEQTYNDGLADAFIQILLKIPFFICLPLTIRFQGSVGGSINVMAEDLSKQVQDVVPTCS